MQIAYHFAGAVALTAVTLAAPVAHADEPPLFGFSVDAYAAPTWDHSIKDQQTGALREGSRGMVGLATLLNWDGLALGGVVDGMPGVFGRLSAGALIGWQPQTGSHRYQVLGEIGQERFGGGGNLLGTPSTPETWLGYVGARLGVSETFGNDGPFELGTWVFVRKDLDDASVTDSGNATQYRLGGYSAGVALRVGVRFDQKRPTNESTIEVQYEPAKS